MEWQDYHPGSRIDLHITGYYNVLMYYILYEYQDKLQKSSSQSNQIVYMSNINWLVALTIIPWLIMFHITHQLDRCDRDFPDMKKMIATLW